MSRVWVKHVDLHFTLQFLGNTRVVEKEVKKPEQKPLRERSGTTRPMSTLMWHIYSNYTNRSMQLDVAIYFHSIKRGPTLQDTCNLWKGFYGGFQPLNSEIKGTHLQLAEIRPPGLVHELQPVVFGEVSQVGDEGGDEEDVPTEGPLLLPEVLHCLCPADVLGGQPPHLTRGEKKVQTNTTITSTPGWPPIKLNLNKCTACLRRCLGPSGNLQDNNAHCLKSFFFFFFFIRFSYLLSPLCWCTNTSTLYCSNDPISL